MDNVYQYETNEDILIAKYIFHKEPVSIFKRKYNLLRNYYFIFVDNREC